MFRTHPASEFLIIQSPEEGFEQPLILPAWPKTGAGILHEPIAAGSHEECFMNNSIFDAVRAELRHADPLCPYITVERLYLELVLTESIERTSQLAIACELLQRARAELVQEWGENLLSPYQQTALRSIDECLKDSRAMVRIYRHTVRREFASVLRNLMVRTQSALREDAEREREHKRKQIAQTIEDMGEGLTIVMECLDSLLSQLLAREELSNAMKQDPEAHSP